MNKAYFLERFRDICGVFGRNMFPEHVQNAVYRQIEALPDAFMDYALSELEREEKLPSNLGRFLKLELWPKYLDNNPQLRAHEVQTGCHRCRDGVPGLRNYWEPDGTAHTCRCICNTDPRTAKFWTPTDDELIARGYLLHLPQRANRTYMPPHIRRAIGNTEPPRITQLALEEQTEDF